MRHIEPGTQEARVAWETIHKRERPGWPPPNLADYSAVRAGFSWEAARAALRGLPGGGLNIAFEAVDRHLDEGLADKVAIRWLPRDPVSEGPGVRDITYRELAALTSRFANLLDRLGVARGAGIQPVGPSAASSMSRHSARSRRGASSRRSSRPSAPSRCRPAWRSATPACW